MNLATLDKMAPGGGGVGVYGWADGSSSPLLARACVVCCGGGQVVVSCSPQAWSAAGTRRVAPFGRAVSAATWRRYSPARGWLEWCPHRKGPPHDGIVRTSSSLQLCLDHHRERVGHPGFSTESGQFVEILCLSGGLA